MRKAILFVLALSFLSLGSWLLIDRVYARLNDYGRVPNHVATWLGANGGPARNNPHGYLWGK